MIPAGATHFTRSGGKIFYFRKLKNKALNIWGFRWEFFSHLKDGWFVAPKTAKPLAIDDRYEISLADMEEIVSTIQDCALTEQESMQYVKNILQEIGAKNG